MPAKGTVSVGTTLRVVLQADPANTGSTALLTGYVADGNHAAPATQFDMVAPGGTATHTTTVSAALALRITVTAPGTGGSGLLEVYQNDVLRDRGTVSSTMWTYSVKS